MEAKEVKIIPPEGFEVDKENSTFECIKFKPIEKKAWRYDADASISGYWINQSGSIIFEGNHTGYFVNIPSNYNLFATEKQAKSALAMARISQIMANDARFGGVVTDEEWNDRAIIKYCIIRNLGKVSSFSYFHDYQFLAFHTARERDLFLEENEDLIMDYLMLE